MDDTLVARMGLRVFIEANDEHEVVAEAGSVEEVRTVLTDVNVRPTVSFIDHKMPGGGEQAAVLIRKKRPESWIVSMTSGDRVDWGDKNYSKGVAFLDTITDTLRELPFKESDS